MFATHTSISADLQPPNNLVVAVGTYCLLCTTGGAPTDGQESISILDAASGSILATWTTKPTSTAIGIVWSYATTATGVNFVLDVTTAGGAAWSGPASVFVPESDLADFDIGVEASFSGSARLSPSQSSVSVIKI